MFTTLREEHPQSVKQALDHFGVPWLAEMDKIVSGDLDADLKLDAGLLALRGNSFKVSIPLAAYRNLVSLLTIQVFGRLDKDFSKFFAPYRSHLVQMAVQNLISLAPHYQQYCVNTTDRPTLPDNYDETLIFEGLIGDIFEFLGQSSRHCTLKTSLIQANDDQEVGTELLQQLLVAVAPLIQIPSAAVRRISPPSMLVGGEELMARRFSIMRKMPTCF